jgi:hypothetical protein
VVFARISVSHHGAVSLLHWGNCTRRGNDPALGRRPLCATCRATGTGEHLPRGPRSHGRGGGLRFMRDPTRGGQRWIDELEDDPLPRIC